VAKWRLRAVRILLVGASLSCCGPSPPSPEELLRRTRDSHPSWQNYSEDIKAHVGAGPVAEWHGKPTAVARDGKTLRVTFSISGPWAARRAVVPVLLRTPYGSVYRSTSAEGTGETRVYLFALTGDAVEGGLPWVELQFPHGHRRIVLDDAGSWSEGDG